MRTLHVITGLGTGEPNSSCASCCAICPSTATW